jgi:SPP1 gp7 family putative phage head morphogenesis protein
MTTAAQRSKLLKDVMIQNQVYLERLKAGEVRKLDPVLRSLDRAVQAALAGLGEGASRAALERTLARLRADNARTLARYTEQVMGTLKALSRHAVGLHAEALSLVWPTNAPPMATPAASATWAATLASPVQATGALLEPFTKSFTARAISTIDRTIRLGHAQGVTTADIVRQLRGTKAANYRDGLIAGILKREGDAMVRTAIQQVNIEAQMAVAKENGVQRYRWLSTLDNRTSQICRSLDGNVYEVGKGPTPPAHINCRSFVILLVEGIDITQGTKRASKGAEGGQQVSASLTYYEWLKTQPFAFQVDALGAARATLFRNGGLTAKQFADLNLDKNFQPLTLEQMRKKNPAAFARAGLEL